MSKTKPDLIKENSLLKQRIKELEQSVSDRKKFEEALQDSENRLREITAQVPGVVYQFYVRPNGAMGFYYISDRSEMVLGLKPDLEGYFERFSSIVIPEHRDGFIKSIEKSVNESSEWQYEGMLQKPSGEIIWFSGNSVPSLRENEIVYNGIVRDITAQKQAEEALQKSGNKYRTLIETTGTGFVVIDKDGLVLDANPEYVRLTGHRDLSEIIGRSVIEWTADSEKEKNTKAIKTAIKKGYIKNLEIDYVDSKGNVTPIEINATSIEIEGRIQTITICRDITERKRIENALRDSRQRYKSLIESANEGIFVAQDNMLRFVNPAFVKIIGYSELELTTKPFINFTHPEDRGMVSERHRRRMRGEKFPSRYEFRMVNREGTTKHVELDSVMIQWDGKPAVLGFISDITLRRQMEEELKQHRDNLEKLVNVKTVELQQEIAEHKLAEMELKKNKEDLESKSKTLEELNTTLRVLLHQREEDKKDLEDRVVSNVKRLVIPYIEKMKKNHLDPQQLSNLNILEANLNEIVSPFLHTVRQLNLTPRETQVASLVKDGKTTKEIAETIGVGISAVDSYRNSIREKLGLNNKKVNLQSYLQSLT